MRNILSIIVCVCVVALMSSCGDDFEKVRKSQDYNKKIERAKTYYDEGEFYKSQILVEQSLPYIRGNDNAEEMYFIYAMTHYELERYVLSSYYFENFAQRFANSPKAEEALYMSAMSHYRLSPNYRLDQTSSQKAIDGFQTFVNTYPQSKRTPEANNLIDEMRAKLEFKAFEQAELYMRMKDYEAAITSYRNLLIEYPETARDEEVRYKIVRSAYRWAKNSVIIKKEDRYKQAVRAYEEFEARYPESEFIADAKTWHSASQRELNNLSQ